MNPVVGVLVGMFGVPVGLATLILFVMLVDGLVRRAAWTCSFLARAISERAHRQTHPELYAVPDDEPTTAKRRQRARRPAASAHRTWRPTIVESPDGRPLALISRLSEDDSLEYGGTVTTVDFAFRSGRRHRGLPNGPTASDSGTA